MYIHEGREQASVLLSVVCRLTGWDKVLDIQHKSGGIRVGLLQRALGRRGRAGTRSLTL